jgi:peroxiredoxin family protein
MSHFTQVKTKMTNERAIVAALEEMGYEVEVHQTAKKLNSRYRAARQQKMKANIILRETAVDFGLLLTEDGTYEVIGDMMYERIRTIANRLPMNYAKQVIIQQAQALGDEYTVVQTMTGYTITVDKTPQLAIGQSSITNQLFVGGSY